jgi:hypothetical protein
MLVVEPTPTKGLFDLSLRAREESLPASAESDQPTVKFTQVLYRWDGARYKPSGPGR